MHYVPIQDLTQKSKQLQTHCVQLYYLIEWIYWKNFLEPKLFLCLLYYCCSPFGHYCPCYFFIYIKYIFIFVGQGYFRSKLSNLKFSSLVFANIGLFVCLLCIVQELTQINTHRDSVSYSQKDTLENNLKGYSIIFKSKLEWAVF